MSAIAKHDQQYQFALQPIVDLHTRKTLYLEMLVRFPDGRNVQEAVLEAEQTRTIHEIDFSVMREAIRLIKSGNLRSVIAVNVSPVTVEQHFPEFQELISSLDGRGRSLVIELTETAPIFEPIMIAAFTVAMQRAGVRVALDDYGCGFCDATRAMFVRPDYIKVGRNGRNGWASMHARELAALHEFASAEPTVLVGEGVETESDRRRLIDLGFQFGQGYYFNRPGVHYEPILDQNAGKEVVPCQ